MPELLGKWYTRTRNSTFQSSSIDTEKDSGTWCYCKNEKGGEMIGCDNKSCQFQWFHIECVGMSDSTIPKGKWLCPTCHAIKHNITKPN